MKKILIIEDNSDVRENTQEILELAGYNAITAENGKVGVDLVRKEKPDLVICDIMMPELDGYGVLRILSKDPATTRIPFIFLTAKAEKNEVRKGMNLGADDYITKPFSEDELLEAIEIRLKKSEAMQKDFQPDLSGLNSFIDEVRGIKELNQLSEDRKIKNISKKEVLYSEGDYANYLYFIVKGKVKCVKTDETGKELVIDIHEKGNFIGYMSLLEGDEYQETAMAVENAQVAVIPKQDFETLIQQNRDVTACFIKMLAGNVLEKEKRLLQLAYTPVRERIASVLLKLVSKENSENNVLKISRVDLANMVGTAKESLIRVLSDFKKMNLIETDGTKIQVLDERGLKKIVHEF